MTPTDFVFPSDADRAENDELNRTCEFAEELLEELSRARTRCKLLRRKTRTQKRNLVRKVAELREHLDTARSLTDEAIALAKARTLQCDQLAAQVNAITSAISTSGAYKTSEELCDLMHSTPVRCLAQHDVEVIERAIDHLGAPCTRFKDKPPGFSRGFNYFAEALKHYANQLLQQANKEPPQ